MRHLRNVITALCAVSQLGGQSKAPDYTQSSIVNAASNLPGALAPNTIATVYGVNLSRSTRGLRASDIEQGRMPTTLSGTGTSILLGGINVPIYYVSPTQVNFLVPAELLPGTARLVVVSEGLSGRPANVTIAAAAPGLFLATPSTPAAVDLQGRLFSPDNPAAPGQWVVLYATGLGASAPPVLTGEIAKTAAWVTAPIRLWLGSVEVVPGYAGLAPGFAGLYQLNVRIPADAPTDPEIRIQIAGMASPAGIFLPLKKPD